MKTKGFVMTKSEQFRLAIEKLKAGTKREYDSNGKLSITEEQDQKDAQIMSDTNNWCCVHVTEYMPLQDKDGNIVVPSAAMGTNGEIARNTVHVTLNHLVENHDGGDWDQKPYVIFARYNDIVAKNGEPVGMDLIDTYFSTDIDRGLVLPKESAYFVHPGDSNATELYKIGEHDATYKTSNFTDEEVEMILSMATPKDRQDYDRFKNGEFERYEIETTLQLREEYRQAVAQGPESRKNFLIKLGATRCNAKLSGILRDFVARSAMQKHGFQYIDDAQNRSVTGKLVDKAVEDVAISKQIDTGFDAHARSAYGIAGLQIHSEKFRAIKVNAVVSETNMDKLFTLLINPDYRDVYQAVIKNDFQDLEEQYDLYEQAFQDFKTLHFEEFAEDEQKRDRYGYMGHSVQKYKTIEEFDPKLAKTLKRQVSVLCDKLRVWRKKMEHEPRFQKLLKKCDDWEHGNYEDWKAFMKQSIEVDGMVAQVMQSVGRE